MKRVQRKKNWVFFRAQQKKKRERKKNSEGLGKNHKNMSWLCLVFFALSRISEVKNIRWTSLVARTFLYLSRWEPKKSTSDYFYYRKRKILRYYLWYIAYSLWDFQKTFFVHRKSKKKKTNFYFLVKKNYKVQKKIWKSFFLLIYSEFVEILDF